MDLFDLEMYVPIMERIILGEETARNFKDKIQMAIIGNEKYINRVYELVTMKLGGKILVIGDKEKALKWLISSPDFPE